MSNAERTDAFRGIAHPLRRKVLRLLDEGERSVGQMLTVFHVPWPTLSRHLAVLRETGLVTQRVSGPYRLYRLRPGAIGRVRRWLTQFEA